MQEKGEAACSSSSAATPHHGRQPDEISLFLHQVLLRSTSTASQSSLVGQRDPRSPLGFSRVEANIRHPPGLLLEGGMMISSVASSDAANLSAAGNINCSRVVGGGPGLPVNNMSSSSVGVSETEADGYDCESEGLEALLEEDLPKPNPPRGSSKRSRTAEVHNLSEKRRRSRINEKMKALQSLIPNSNKTDKASMLDEAIEYLKQLQLQVQMLSMRNGLSLHPMCLPGVMQPIQLSQTRMGFEEENRALRINMTPNLPVNEETSTQTVFGVPSDHTIPSEPSMSNLMNSEITFGLESSVQTHPLPFQLKSSLSEEIVREDMPRCSSNQPAMVAPPDADPFGRNMRPAYSLSKIGFDMDQTAAPSLPLASLASNRRGGFLQSSGAGSDHSQG